MFYIYKMDCQKLIVYGILILVGLYLLKDVCGVKLPFIDEGFENEGEGIPEEEVVVTQGLADSPGPPPATDAPSPNGELLSQPQEVAASEPNGNEVEAPIQGINTEPSSCYPQKQLSPSDLLPEGDSAQVQGFDKTNPNAEGILKGVNFLDSGFHVGVNTIGQSLRNANRGLRSEPANPRVAVSPWMNSTIGADLTRKTLGDDKLCGTEVGEPSNVVGNMSDSSAAPIA